MKIIKKNAAYVQKYYFKAFVGSTLVTQKAIPLSILEIMNSKSFKRMEKKDFVKITKPEEIAFIKQADWIIDYDEYMKKGTDEINDEIRSLDKTRIDLGTWFHDLPTEERKKEYAKAVSKDRMLRYEIESLSDMVLLKQHRAYNRIPGDSILKRIFRTNRNN